MRDANPSPDRVHFEPGNACALPFSDSSFDLVLSSLVLMFVPDGALAAREMARVAKPGGMVAAATCDLRGGVIAARMLHDTMVALGRRGPFSSASRTDRARSPRRLGPPRDYGEILSGG